MPNVKVLVISSDPVLQGFLQRNLREYGYQSYSTKDCGEGLRALLDAEVADLVLLDAMMPTMEGIEVSLRIRQWCQVPILMLSAWGAGRDKVRRLDFSSDDYLTEPLDAAGLISHIENVLRRNEAARSGVSAGAA